METEDLEVLKEKVKASCITSVWCSFTGLVFLVEIHLHHKLTEATFTQNSFKSQQNANINISTSIRCETGDVQLQMNDVQTISGRIIQSNAGTFTLSNLLM